MAKKVFIAIGHGGKDPGAVGNDLKEKDLNLSIALACQAELVRHGVSVLTSRVKDENDDVSERIKECNAFDPDLACDIHTNAGGGDGAEVYHTIGGGTGKTLANNILAEVVEIGQNSRGAKTKKNSNGRDYFGFIRQTVCPAVIVECAFIDNKKDIAIIDTEAEQKKMGIAIAKGFLKTLGITYKEPAKKQKTCEVTLPVLKKGDSGEYVKTMQLLLIGHGHNLSATGNYGNGTEKALHAFKKKVGLAVTSNCGVQTWSALLGVK